MDVAACKAARYTNIMSDALLSAFSHDSQSGTVKTGIQNFSMSSLKSTYNLQSTTFFVFIYAIACLSYSATGSCALINDGIDYRMNIGIGDSGNGYNIQPGTVSLSSSGVLSVTKSGATVTGKFIYPYS